jgi:hypothetical protein
MESVIKTPINVEEIKNMVVRYKGIWYKINAKSYEPERQTNAIVWKMLKGTEQLEAYRQWFSEQQKDSKLLYPDFRKE